MVFTGAGYFLGVHAPGKKAFAISWRQCTMQLYARLKEEDSSGNYCRSYYRNDYILFYIEPYRKIDKDVLAANKVDTLLNRLFIEPLLGMGYPVNDLPVLKRIDNFMKPGDDERLAFDMDFIGIQNYTRELVRHSYLTPFVQAKIIQANKRKVKATVMNWEVFPEAIYKVLKKYSAYPNIPKLIITENGAAFPDEVVDGNIADGERVQYLNDHIKQVLRAKNEGVNVGGYFVWTLLDNFEWAKGTTQHLDWSM